MVRKKLRTWLEALKYLGCRDLLRGNDGKSAQEVAHFLNDLPTRLADDKNPNESYKASFALGVTEIGCMAHARRKLFKLHATNKSTLTEEALRYIQLLYEIESEVRDLEPDLRRRIRQEKAIPVMDRLHAWMIAQRDLMHEGSAISRALVYSLKRLSALSRYLNDGAVFDSTALPDAESPSQRLLRLAV